MNKENYLDTRTKAERQEDSEIKAETITDTEKQKKPTEKELREIADEHRCLSEVIERLLDAGWLDSERVADMIATELMENPYGVKVGRVKIKQYD